MSSAEQPSGSLRPACELGESDPTFRGILGNLIDGYLRIDADGTVVAASASCEALLGGPVAAIVGASFGRDVFADPARHDEFARSVRERGSARDFETTFRRRDGTPVAVSVNATRCVDPDGVDAGIECIVRDVTDRDRMRKLEAIGALAGTLAHDFSNLFTSILGYASILQVRAAENPEIARAADVIVSTARKASELTRKFAALAQRGRLTSAPVDLHALIADVVGYLRTARRTADVVCHLDAPRAVVTGDPQQLRLLMLNLGANAVEAAGDAGHVAFATAAAAIASADAAPQPAMTPGAYVAVTVSDSGPGVAADAAGRIFEPFFTTKPQAEHLGLGLPVAFGIARNHGGSITATTGALGGAAFRVLIPLSHA